MPTPEELAAEFGFQSKSKKTETNSPDKYDTLAAEFGYDPNYKEPPKQELSFWQGLQKDPTLYAAVKRTGIGALRGAKDVLDTGAEVLAKGTSYVADKLLPESLSAPIRESAESSIEENKKGRDAFNKEYPPSEGILPTAAEAGRITGQVAATLPVMPTKAFGAIQSAAGALPTVMASGQKVAAPLLNRLTAAAGSGALGGAVLGAATSSSNDKSLAENVGEGALAGAIGGPLIEGAMFAGKGLANKVVGKISPMRSQLAERAEQLGINLKATQVSDSPTLKKYDQISGMLPFSGSQGISNTQLNQFTRAVSRTFGKDVEEITPDVVKTARKDIGANMEAIYNRSTVAADPQLQNDIINIIREVRTNLPEVEQRPILNNIQNIASKVNSAGFIDGPAFNSLIKYDATLSKLQKSSNPNIRQYANELRSSLENALTRSVGSVDKQELTNLRRQYKSVMTIKDMVENDPEGKVNPLKLMRKVTQAPGGKVGSGELGELADIGRSFFINPSDSGTPLGTYILNNIAPAIHNPVSAAAAAGGAMLSGAGFMDLGLGAVGLITNRLARNAVNSETVKQGMISAGKGSNYGIADKVTKKLLPYSSTLTDNRKSKNETLKLPVALEKNR